MSHSQTCEHAASRFRFGKGGADNLFVLFSRYPSFTWEMPLEVFWTDVFLAHWYSAQLKNVELGQSAGKCLPVHCINPYKTCGERKFISFLQWSYQTKRALKQQEQTEASDEKLRLNLGKKTRCCLTIYNWILVVELKEKASFRSGSCPVHIHNEFMLEVPTFHHTQH